jgi:biotin-(acetyl-CoA carboxylase) ligase
MTRRLELDQVALEGADPAVEQTSGHGSLSRPWIKKENKSTRTSSSFRARYT